MGDFNTFKPVLVTQMNSLNYDQKKEVKKIAEKVVDNKMNQQSFLDSFRKYFEQAHFHQMVKDKAETVVPEVGKEWARNNLRVETESVANNYMRNNFMPFFRREVAENKDVQGFISQHLKSVDERVAATADQTVKRIVDTSSEFNPIFQQHLSILTDRNQQELKKQSNHITEALDSMKKVRAQNDELREKNEEFRKRTEALERTNNFWAGISTASLMGVVGLGIHAYLRNGNRS